jgi:hypothetical protein
MVNEQTASIDESTYDTATGTMPPSSAPRPSWDDTLDVPEGRRKLVEKWVKKLKDSEDNPKIKKAFKRARECMYLATNGGKKEWVEGDNFTVAIGPRHINLTTAALYAKNPVAISKRRHRLQFSVWDGKQQSLAMAMQGAHPMAAQILAEVAAAQDYEQLATRMGKALELLWAYYTGEQEASFKLQMKAAVRRTKVCGASYVRLGFQRILEPNPEVTQKIGDATRQITTLQQQLDKMARDSSEYEEGSAQLEQIATSLASLQQEAEQIVREGPVFGFPKFHDVLIDPCVKHLKTLAGAGWIAYIHEVTPDEGERLFKKHVGSMFTPRVEAGAKVAYGDKEEKKARFFEVWDRDRGTVFVVCEGYPDFVQEPAPPKVKLERFFDLFPIVFNEVESDDDIFPPSDLWLARHPMDEYNRSRQGLREHRTANRPKYATPRGALEEEDKMLLTSAPAHSVVEIDGLAPNEDIKNKLQRIEMIAIDPNQYEVEQYFKDILRAVGSQEANFGTTSGDTATEASIAQNSQSATQGDNRDDLDEMLSELARSFGQLCLSELSAETVIEICGPGAPWPDAGITREVIQKDLMLDVRAGSSGRPNAQAELAKIERIAPYLLQIPGVNPEPLIKKAADLLEIDVEELYVEGLPSITAMNAMLTKAGGSPQGGAAGGGEDPNMQGGQGAQNAPSTQTNEPGPQPAYPAPGEATPQPV